MVIVHPEVPRNSNGAGLGPLSRTPHLGEHTYEVLRELGVNDEELAQLREQHIIDGEPDMWAEPTPRAGVLLPYERYQEMGSILRIDRDYQPLPL